MRAIRLRPNSVVLVAVIILLAIPAKAGFKLIDLGTLGGNASSALAINDRGEVVGQSEGPDGILHAFCYRGGILRSLNMNPCEATAINDAGRIVGGGLIPVTNIFILPPLPLPFPTNPIVIPPTNIIIAPPWPTNPIVIGPTNPIIILPINPVVIPPTNIIVVPLTNNLIQFSDLTAREAAVTASSQILSDESTTNIIAITNISYISRPALFGNGSLIYLFRGTNSGVAAGINNRDEIVGSVSADDAPTHAFIYRNGFTMNLGTLGGSFSAATGINNRDDVVGFSSTPTQNEGVLSGYPLHPFLYHHGWMRDLGTLGGSAGEATAINDVGEVVGWSTTISNVEIHAFLYSKGKMTDLGALGNGPSFGLGPRSYSSALAINNWGQVVGTSASTNGEHAFLYRNGRMTDLNSLVTLTQVGGPPGFVMLTYARGINDWGQIVGEGLFWDGTDTSTRAFLMERRPGHRLGGVTGRPSAH